VDAYRARIDEATAVAHPLKGPFTVIFYEGSSVYSRNAVYIHSMLDFIHRWRRTACGLAVIYPHPKRGSLHSNFFCYGVSSCIFTVRCVQSQSVYTKETRAHTHRELILAFPLSVVKCLWGVFVWGFGCCPCRACVCRGCCYLSVCVCLCV